uniref:ZSWIM3 N-terminal domain-containing protein n=1 Tax=Panagrolaimus superbus TaxID=310955 RepID=A0A914YRH6_9BILA
MAAEFDSYGNLPYQWKKNNTDDSHKWITEVPGNTIHEEMHSETASSPQSSSGTIGSDVVSNSSPEAHTPIVSPVQSQSQEPSTNQFEASTAEENGAKQDDTSPVAHQEYSELKVDVVESKDAIKVATDELYNLPDPDPSNPPTISIGAKFVSFAHFESIFEPWKQQHFHPFRVASSETMRHPDGQQDPVFKYRYIVYHCVHYGTPRMRGNGKRPNQSYLPSGCKAMLRLNFSYNDNSLRITTLHTEHQNHEIGPDHFCGKVRKISPLSEVNSKKDSPRSIKSSPSCKPSPATTQSSSQMPSFPSSPNVQFSSNTSTIQSSADASVPKQDITKDIPTSNLSLATMLAAAYSNNNNPGNTFSMFQSSQPCIIPQQIPIVNNNNNGSNSLAALLSQKENFSSSGNGSTSLTNTINPNPPLIYPHPIPSSQQFQSIEDMVKHRDSAFSSLLGQQQQVTNENPLAKLYEALQKQTLHAAIEQYRMKLVLQEKLQARNEEYRTIMNLLNNGNIPLSNLTAMDRILALLRQVVECIHTSN